MTDKTTAFIRDLCNEYEDCGGTSDLNTLDFCSIFNLSRIQQINVNC